jgi:hypothetical protein
LTLSDGRKVFVKAVSSAQNPDSPGFIRRELHAVGHLPPDAPAPRLLGSIDDGEWVAVIFEHIDGRLPVVPWGADELSRALAALGELNRLRAPAGLHSAVEHLQPMFNGWELSGGREEYVALERRSIDLLDGDRLVHNDVRSDNILVADDGSIVFVDWAHACRGPIWLDIVLWLPALVLEGGGRPEEVLARLDADHRPPTHVLPALAAALAGYFVYNGSLPDPPGLPTVREFQRAQAVPALAWLDRLLDQ